MKTRASKRLALGAALIMATLAMNSAFADGTRAFKIRFAGGFVKNIQQAQVDMMDIPTGLLESRSMALIKGRGTFGNVDIMAVTVSGRSHRILPEGWNLREVLPLSSTAISAGMICQPFDNSI